MTINDIMLRDMAEADRLEKREDEMREYEREISRRLWRRRGKLALDVAGGILLFALLVAFCWLCCAASGYHWE